MNKEKVQNNLYLKLVSSDIQPITSRYIAMKLQELENTSIKNIENIEASTYIIETDNKKYKVETHLIDIPDAGILEL